MTETAFAAQEDVEDPRPYRFSVNDFRRFPELGVVKVGDRCELVDGHLFVHQPERPMHRRVVDRTAMALRSRSTVSTSVLVREPVVIDRFSELSPDAVVLHARDDDYAVAPPHPEDVILVVEVSDSTYDYDEAKTAVYARGYVPEVWVVDIDEKTVHVFTRPDGSAYGRHRTYTAAESLCIPALDAEVPVRDLLPAD